MSNNNSYVAYCTSTTNDQYQTLNDAEDIIIGITIKQLIEIEKENKVLMRFTLTLKFLDSLRADLLTVLVNDKTEISKKDFRNYKRLDDSGSYSMSASLEEIIEMKDYADFNPYIIKTFPIRFKINSYDRDETKVALGEKTEKQKINVKPRSIPDFLQFQPNSWSSNVSTLDSISIQYFNKEYIPEKNVDLSSRISDMCEVKGVNDCLVVNFISRSDQLECLTNNWMPILFINTFLSISLISESEAFENSLIGSVLALVLSQRNNVGSGTLRLYLTEYVIIFIMYVLKTVNAELIYFYFMVLTSFISLAILFIMHYMTSIKVQDKHAGFSTTIDTLIKGNLNNTNREATYLDRFRFC
jgi:hypothetical protein